MRANKRVFVSGGSQAAGYLLFRFAIRRAASNLSLSFRFLHIWPSLAEDTEVYFESNSTPNLTTVIGRICAVNPCSTKI